MCLEAPVLNSTVLQWEKGGLHWLTNPVPTLPWAGDKVNPIFISQRLMAQFNMKSFAEESYL